MLDIKELEVDGHLDCSFDAELNKTYDERYQEVPNFSIS